MKEKKKMSLAMQIFIALVLAIIAGLLMQNYADFAESYIKPFGTIFLNLIKFIVVPIVLFSIMCGIISMSDIRKVGSIGLKTVVFYLCTTAFAVTIGLIGGNLFKSLRICDNELRPFDEIFNSSVKLRHLTADCRTVVVKKLSEQILRLLDKFAHEWR